MNRGRGAGVRGEDPIQLSHDHLRPAVVSTALGEVTGECAANTNQFRLEPRHQLCGPGHGRLQRCLLQLVAQLGHDAGPQAARASLQAVSQPLDGHFVGRRHGRSHGDQLLARLGQEELDQLRELFPGGNPTELTDNPPVQRLLRTQRTGGGNPAGELPTHRSTTAAKAPVRTGLEM